MIYWDQTAPDPPSPVCARVCISWNTSISTAVEISRGTEVDTDRSSAYISICCPPCGTQSNQQHPRKKNSKRWSENRALEYYVTEEHDVGQYAPNSNTTFPREQKRIEEIEGRIRQPELI